jgi:SAM-dependent methyltransferase
MNKALHVWKSEGFSGVYTRLGNHLRHRRPNAAKDDFDESHRTSTAGGVDLWQLSIPSKDWTSGVRYGPISVEMFERFMGHLPINPSEYTFIDLGSGKGRALILASEHGFKNVIGVEFSPDLCREAERNIAVTRANAVVRCKSAADFAFPKEPTVVFIYNAFFGDILKTVIDHIHPDGYLVYVNPKHADLVSFPVIHGEDGLKIYEMRR